ncbi:hypothetical protein MYAER_0557 [Microcystis aeruginosa NIES-2549]|uniref:Uncharacterized protein n=1 Tax=Microcystis aeruginosa NIES-2549 TaxID=1641812 RepID=A0A0F6U1M0_MICAE|nr:hypothetical protein [Microcystis aeruginosa]AKE62917.1 hypothetical protein MYAER_0557 [Microcystis aeruginosa NIES-2549]AOC51309.1 hypothetical protein amyaer_0560 [Microcystis aeruginosa NIES-2481]
MRLEYNILVAFFHYEAIIQHFWECPYSLEYLLALDWVPPENE